MRHRRPDETFSAEPLRAENSWRVLGSWGTVETFRVSQADAEKIAADLNALPELSWIRPPMPQVQREAADKIVLELQAMRARAHACGLHVTAHALHRTMNAAGWEIAGDIIKADQAAREWLGEEK